MKRALILATMVAALAACGGEPQASDVGATAELVSVPPLRGPMWVYIDISNGTYDTGNAGMEDYCTGLNPPAFSCDDACKQDLVDRVRIDFYDQNVRKIPINVTTTRPTTPGQIYQTVVVTGDDGGFCGIRNAGGITPGDPAVCHSWIPMVSYVFAGPGYHSPQAIADRISHEAGHQYGLNHTISVPGMNDIMGVGGPDPGHSYFYSGIAPVGGLDNYCYRPSQDDYAILHSIYQTAQKLL